jgi:hypothetical protein
LLLSFELRQGILQSLFIGCVFVSLGIKPALPFLLASALLLRMPFLNLIHNVDVLMFFIVQVFLVRIFDTFDLFDLPLA